MHPASSPQDFRQCSATAWWPRCQRLTSAAKPSSQFNFENCSAHFLQPEQSQERGSERTEMSSAYGRIVQEMMNRSRKGGKSSSWQVQTPETVKLSSWNHMFMFRFEGQTDYYKWLSRGTYDLLLSTLIDWLTDCSLAALSTQIGYTVPVTLWHVFIR